jgi:hypothetical protein
MLAMNSHCPSDPDRFWQPSAEDDPTFTAHLAECTSCRAQRQRAERGVRLLRALPPQRAPQALDGAVVASLHAGTRQERAIRQVEALTRLKVPAELSSQVEATLVWTADQPAPAELGARLRAELAAPSEAMSRRLLGRLDRLRAPQDLDRRMSVPARNFARRRAIAFAGALLVVMGLGSLAVQRWGAELSSAQQQPRVAIQWNVEIIESAEGLDPVARALIGGLSGGSSEVLGKEKL